MSKFISKDNLIQYDELIKNYITNKVLNIEDNLAYGVLWNINVSDPHLTRIGNMRLHKELPIQNGLKGCIALKDRIIYWLNEDDWRFRKESITKTATVSGSNTIVADIFSTLQYDKLWIKINGTAYQISSINVGTKTATLDTTDTLSGTTVTIELGAVLNGYDGTVRVHCPRFYYKSVEDGDIRKVLISMFKVDDTYHCLPELLLDAYRSTVLNTVPENMGYLSTLPINSAISVVNTNTYCRGGENRSAYDAYLETDPSKSDLGKPRTSLSRATMRTYSRNAGSEMLSYDLYKNIFYWLYIIEYANFNCQEAYNDTLTAEGYKQGGLGDGVTTIEDGWEYYNEFCPITPCGYCNEFGNGTGLKTITIVIPTTSGGNPTITYNFSVPRWRGFDNPFDDIVTNLDGIIVQGTKDNYNYVYITTNPEYYGDDETAKNNMYIAGRLIKEFGYTSLFDLGDAAHIIPKDNKGTSTTYMCDYGSFANNNSGFFTLFVGGFADGGAGSGLGSFDSGLEVSVSGPNIGFRSVSSVSAASSSVVA